VLDSLDPESLPRGDLWESVSSDLATRGALGGALAGLYAALVLGWWLWRDQRMHQITRSTPIRVLIAGSRGKSSTVRLIHAALTHAGYRTFAKCTGTAAAEINTDSVVTPTTRLGQVSVLEMMDAVFRANKESADALVFENMAVSPDLITLVSEEIVRPNVSVITNAHLDHLEEEGQTREEVMQSLAGVIGGSTYAITAERDPTALARLRWITRQRKVEVVPVSGEYFLYEQLPLDHPDNIATALAVTRSLGILDSVSMRGMVNATHESGYRVIPDRVVEGTTLRLLDLGAINDPQSAATALNACHDRVIPDAPVCAVLTGRSDRPLRDLEFAALLQPGVVDLVFLRGGPVVQTRKILLDHGWDPRRIATLRFYERGSRRFAQRLRRQLGSLSIPLDRVTVILLENIHDPVIDSIRSEGLGGES